jgi:hypothetical protein
MRFRFLYLSLPENVPPSKEHPTLQEYAMNEQGNSYVALLKMATHYRHPKLVVDGRYTSAPIQHRNVRNLAGPLLRQHTALSFGISVLSLVTSPMMHPQIKYTPTLTATIISPTWICRGNMLRGFASGGLLESNEAWETLF